MSTSSGAGSRGNTRRGFTLVEALVALVVAGLMLASLGRALGGAWSATRVPMDVMSGIALARNVAEGAPVPAEARRLGFSADRREGTAAVLVLPAEVAPPPRGTGAGEEGGGLKPDATPSAIRLAVPKGLGVPPAGTAKGVALRSVSVAVRTPAGRRLTLDTVKLADAPE